MRFIELFAAVSAMVAIVHAAPTRSGEVNLQNAPVADTHKMSFEPKYKGASARRQNHQNRQQKRHKPCCEAGVGLNLGASLDIGASVEANIGGPAVNVAPVVLQNPAPVPPTVNRNDRVGDSVVVVVDANHA